VKGRLNDVGRGTGTHVLCHCGDCRAAARHLTGKVADTADVYQTTPDRITFLQGFDRLAVLRLSPRGLNRVYATCCNTAICNLIRTRQVPFAGWHVDTLSDSEILGPVVTEGFIQKGEKIGHKGILHSVGGVLSRALSARIDGRWRQTPFFAEDGDLTMPVHLMSRDERRAAYSE